MVVLKSLRSAARWTRVGVLAIVVALIGALAVSSGGWLLVGHILVLTLLWASVAAAWNLLGGLAGQVSLGQSAFFGIGAYTSTLIYLDAGISPWFGMIVAAVLGSVAAVIIGLPTFRLRGPYFSLGTLAFAIIAQNVAVQLRDITRGSIGIPIPFREGLANLTFLGKEPYIIFGLGLLTLVTGLSFAISRSRLGFQLSAIRDDEDAAQSLGIHTSLTKLKVAAISGALTSVAGTLYAQYVLFVVPSSVFSVDVSIQAIVLSVVGGTGTVFGPLLGAITIVPIGQVILNRFLGSFPGLNTILTGTILVAVVFLAPGGLAEVLGRRRGRREESALEEGE